MTITALIACAVLGAADPAEVAVRQAYVSSLAAADLALKQGAPIVARRHLANAPAPLRGWEWQHLLARSMGEATSIEVGDGAVYAITCTGDGQLAVTACADRVIRVIDTFTGQVKRTMERGRRGHEKAPIAVSPDGRLVAIAAGSRIEVFDLSTLAMRCSFDGHEDRVTCLAFSPDGSSIVSGAGKTTVRLWDTNTGDQIASRYAHTSLIQCVAYSPDGQTICSGGDDNRGRLWHRQLEERGPALERHGTSVRSIAFSPDGRTVATGSADGLIRLAGVDDGRNHGVVGGLDQPVVGLAFSPDGRRLAGRSLGGLAEVRDLSSGERLMSMDGVASLAFSPAGDVLVGTRDGRIERRALDPAPFERLADGGVARDLAFSPDSRSLASSSDDGVTRRWDLVRREPVASIDWYAGGGSALAWVPDGSALVAGAGVEVAVLDADSLEVINRYTGHADRVTCLAISADGRRIASGSADHTVRIWTRGEPRPLFTLPDQGAQVRAVALSASGERVAMGSWEVAAFDLTAEPRAMPCPVVAGPVAAIVIVGEAIVSAGSDHVITWWNPASDEVRRLHGHHAPVTCLTVSPDGTRLVSGSMDRTVRLWDAATGAAILTLAHEVGVTALAFSPDGTRIASAGVDGDIRLWDSMPRTEREALRRRAPAAP